MEMTSGRRLLDLVNHHPVHGRPDKVEHVVDAGGKRMDVLAVDRRKEGLVQVLHDVVSEHVAFLLELVDGLCLLFEWSQSC